jgi:small subunit ribosomal protein S2
MALPDFSMRELIDAGVHFGHKTKRWNPRMAPFIYGERNGVHIINLQKSVPLLHHALKAVQEVSAKNGRILFVGTKRQASDVIAEAARRCGQYYVNQRWLGGMLTNWKTIQNSIRQMKKIEETLSSEESGFTKKERLSMQRQYDKLEKSLGGIRDMAGVPDMLVVVDVIREDLAIKEAQKLGIPIVAIVDTNASIEGIDYPVPGNDDATRAITLYCKLASDAVLDGIQQSDGDIEQSFEAAPVEEVVAEEAPAQEEAAANAKATTKKAAYADAAKKAAKKKQAIEVAEKAKAATEEDAPAADSASA